MPKIYERKTLGLELAEEITHAAVAHAKSKDQALVIAIVDDSGIQKAMVRMDGAHLISIQVAIDKAYTAAGYGLSTDAWYDFAKGDEPIAFGAVGGIDRLVTLGGGYPIMIDGSLVGGIGVSGGHYTDDMAVAQAGLQVLSNL